MREGPPIGVLVMAYGTAAGPDDVERYYTHIRGGRAPSLEHLQELKDRYEAIGNVFPLLDTTTAQARGLVERLNADADGHTYRSFLGMKHSPPFIPDGVEAMRADGIERGIGVVMAPHWSGMSVETYVERVAQAVDDHGETPEFTFVRSYSDHPAFISFLTGRVREALDGLPEGVRDGVAVIFSAHSLPVRTVDDGSLRCKYCDCDDSCRYRDGLQRTSDLVADALGLEHYLIAWQSAGRTADPWWGPPVEDVIQQLAMQGHSAVLVCSAGFVADHLEVLYDLDIEARHIAEEAGLVFARTRMPNADPEYLDVLAQVVRDHMAEARTT